MSVANGSVTKLSETETKLSEAKRSETETKPVIILDIDGTLIDSRHECVYDTSDYAYQQEIGDTPILVSAPSNYDDETLYVYRRPYLNEFLEFCKDHFRVGLWTNATWGWLNTFRTHVLPRGYPIVFERALSEDDHDTIAQYPHDSAVRQVIMQKPLREVYATVGDASAKNTLIVEDTPMNCVNDIDSVVAVQPFDYHDFATDVTLVLLERYLRRVLAEGSFDRIDHHDRFDRIDHRDRFDRIDHRDRFDRIDHRGWTLREIMEKPIVRLGSSLVSEKSWSPVSASAETN